MMQFAVNYSPALAELVRAGLVHLDLFKCPAWPDLIAEAARVLPVYIHFPLVVGGGQGHPIDSETGQPADLERMYALAEQTGTPLINTHFFASQQDYPDIPAASLSVPHMRQVVDGMLRDLEPLIRRFGAERVLVENITNEAGMLRMTVAPEVLEQILARSGCGFLFDLSHARLAARDLGLDERAYCASLPVQRMREVHITGLQLLTGDLLERMLAADRPGGFISQMAGRYMDHFAMTAADWSELSWLLGEIRRGQAGQSAWNTPWVISNEFGGVGGFWEVVSDPQVYLEQIPRMAAMIKEGSTKE
jgi:uncharacterized protein